MNDGERKETVLSFFYRKILKNLWNNLEKREK